MRVYTLHLIKVEHADIQLVARYCKTAERNAERFEAKTYQPRIGRILDNRRTHRVRIRSPDWGML